MGNLASTYFALGRHSDALAMKERVLEFRRRVLPADHPHIGEGCEGKGFVASGLVIVREMRCVASGVVIGSVSVWFDLTCRPGHEQPCFNVPGSWKALGCACDA